MYSIESEGILEGQFEEKARKGEISTNISKEILNFGLEIKEIFRKV